MRLFERRHVAYFSGTSLDASASSTPFFGHSLYRRSLMVLALLALAAHVLVAWFAGGHGPVLLLSNVIQLVLGVLTVLAMLEAGSRSSRFGRRIWSLAALAFAFYTVGQAVFTYSAVIQPHSRQFGALIYDPIFFFWIVPLVAAAVANPAEIAKGFEWRSILNFSLLVLLALALHFTVFSDVSSWNASPEQVLFWRFKIRLIRDVIVLCCLWGRVLVADSPQIRALFVRLGGFYCLYALSNAIYLYVNEATHAARPGPVVDLVWSIPRVLVVFLAATWNWTAEISDQPPASNRWRTYLLDRTPMVVPLLILAVSVRAFSSSPLLWGGFIVATLGIVSLRLRLTELRQDRALERLHTSNNLLEAFIECTSETVFIKDADGRYLLINPAGARGLRRAPEEIVGKSDYDLFDPEQAETLRKNDRTAMESGQAFTIEESLDVKGLQRTFLTTKNAYRDPQGRVIGVVGISVNITERRRMEQHLEKAQRMESIGTFSSGIAHDFNNLLTVIKGYSYLAHADAEGNAAVRENVDQIQKATSRASALIDQLLAFTRQQILKPRVISLNDIVTQLRKMLGRLIGEDVQIETRLDCDLGAVRADPVQIEQVLMNLAANARDAMPRGGTLLLHTANVNVNHSVLAPDLNVPPGAYSVLTVSDSGSGMDAQTQAHIFEPFFTTKPVGKGTGLGLATVYGIVEQSGGHIRVESKPGSGTTFRIYLPRVREPVTRLSLGAPAPAPQGGHQTILVVDDDPQLRQLATKVLTASGFRVLEADGSEQAERLAALHSGSIHLLLTDVVLPGMSGRDIARQICGETSVPRVLYMSGYPDDTIAHHGMLDPGIVLLTKPFSPDRLLEKVKEILEVPA